MLFASTAKRKGDAFIMESFNLKHTVTPSVADAKNLYPSFGHLYIIITRYTGSNKDIEKIARTLLYAETVIAAAGI